MLMENQPDPDFTAEFYDGEACFFSFPTVIKCIYHNMQTYGLMQE